jgi:hypothetical protein
MGKFCSPLRVDKNPTCSFLTDDAGRVIMKDFSGHFYGDCFQFVMAKYNVTFFKAIRIIAQDFGISREEEVFTPQAKKSYLKENMKHRKPTNYYYKVDKWNSRNVSYWRDNFRVEAEMLDAFCIKPIKTLWRGDEIVYRWQDKDPCFIYYFGKDDFKIYYPLRDKFKFISQAKSIQGWNQLPKKHNILVITKSMKDVVIFGLLGIPAIAPQSESTLIDDKVMKEIFKRFRSVFVVYDFDLTGVSYSNRLRRKYEKKINQFFFTNGRFGSADYGGKDPSDILKEVSSSRKDQIVASSKKQLSIWSTYTKSFDRRTRSYKSLHRSIEKVLEDMFACNRF